MQNQSDPSGASEGMPTVCIDKGTTMPQQGGKTDLKIRTGDTHLGDQIELKIVPQSQEHSRHSQRLSGPRPHILGVFCTHKDHGPNVQPELKRIAECMGTSNAEAALRELRPERQHVVNLSRATILWQANGQSLLDRLVDTEPDLLHLACHNPEVTTPITCTDV